MPAEYVNKQLKIQPYQLYETFTIPNRIINKETAWLTLNNNIVAVILHMFLK